MTEKPPLWADILLTFWVLVVGVFYFGGYFFPALGAYTPKASAFYALMVLASAGVLAYNYLHRPNLNDDAPEANKKDRRTKNKK